jgi:hypothetical protein
MKEIIENPKLYNVEWQDAHSDSAWLSEKDLKEFINRERCICQNIGWLLNETEDEIVIASRRMKWAEDGDTKWGMIQKIPKAWIKKKEIVIEDLISKEEAK